MLISHRRRKSGYVEPLNGLRYDMMCQSRHVLALSKDVNRKKAESPLVKMAISASVTWVFELGIGHFLEFLKIVKQTKSGTYAELTREITKQKGVIGIWDGFFPWGTVQSLAKGAVFGWGHAMARQALHPYVESGTIPLGLAEVISGGVGGGVQGLVLSPTLLLKTRVMTDPIFREKMSIWQTSSQSATVGLRVIRNEGLPALMKGSIVFSMKRVADWSTRFFFSVMCENIMFKRHDHEKQLTMGEKIAASLMGGTLSTLTTLPIDVMVAQIQQASKAGSKVSVLGTFKTQYQQGGMQKVAGFATKGFVARVTHVALTTMLMKTVASAIYEKYEELEG